MNETDRVEPKQTSLVPESLPLTEPRLSSIPKSLIPIVGVNGSALVEEMVRTASKATLKTPEGLPFFFRPILRSEDLEDWTYQPLIDQFPWMSESGLRKLKKQIEQEKLVTIFRRGNRWDESESGVLKRTHRYHVPDAIIKRVRDDEHLHYDWNEARAWNDLLAALVINVIRWEIALLQLSHPDRKTLTISLGDLQKRIPVSRASLLNKINFLIAQGELIKHGASEYALGRENNLIERAKEHDGLPKTIKTYIDSLKMTEAERNYHLDRIENELRTYYMDRTHMQIFPVDEKHFRPAAEICLDNNLDTPLFIDTNIQWYQGGKRVHKRAKYLTGKFALTNYYRREKAYHLERTMAEHAMSIDLQHYNYLSDHVKGAALPNWYKLVCLPPEIVEQNKDAPAMKELIDSARMEMAAKHYGSKQALKATAFYWQNLYPDEVVKPAAPAAPVEQPEAQAEPVQDQEPAALVEGDFVIGKGYRYYDEQGQEQFRRNLALAS